MSSAVSTGGAGPSETTARLWTVYDRLAGQLAERQSRSGVLVGVAIGMLAAVVAASFAPQIGKAVTASAMVRVSYVAVIAYTSFLVVASILSLNPGLPWERRGAIQGIALLVGEALNANAPRRRRKDLDDRYSETGLTFVQVARIDQGAPADPAGDVQAALRAITPDDVAWHVIAVAYELHQYRQWRRFVTLLILFGLAGIALVVFAILYEAIQLPDLLIGGAVALALVILVVIVVRQIPSWGEA